MGSDKGPKTRPADVAEGAAVHVGKTCEKSKTFNLTYAEVTVSCGRQDGHESWAPVHLGQMTVPTMPVGAKKSTGTGTIVFHWE